MGIIQSCHGKRAPLALMAAGDGIFLYAPKIDYAKEARYKAFVGVGLVKNDEVYQVEMGQGFYPFRRDAQFFDIAQDALLSTFPIAKDRWVRKFRFGQFEIVESDFFLVAAAMGVPETTLGTVQQRLAH